MGTWQGDLLPAIFLVSRVDVFNKSSLLLTFRQMRHFITSESRRWTRFRGPFNQKLNPDYQVKNAGKP